jgi:hypothetical protein
MISEWATIKKSSVNLCNPDQAPGLLWVITTQSTGSADRPKAIAASLTPDRPLRHSQIEV